MDNAITTQDLLNENFTRLVEDINTIIVERGFRANMEVLECRWEVGERIIHDEEYKLAKEQNRVGKFLEAISNQVKLRKTEIYNSTQWYSIEQRTQKIPTPNLSDALERLPNGKSISWYKLCGLLPELSAESKEEIDTDDKPLDSNLILGDCIKTIQDLPDSSIDLVLTDPPYGIDYQSNRRVVKEQLNKIANDKTTATNLLNLTCYFLSAKMKPNRHLYFFSSWKNYPAFAEAISPYFEIKNVIVWDKQNHGAGDLESYGERYELIIFATNGRRSNQNESRPDNIMTCPRVFNPIHPNEKPVKLLTWLINNSTKEGELVLDPFMGSGATCLAAKESDRKYLGIEIDEEWYKKAQDRMK